MREDKRNGDSQGQIVAAQGVGILLKQFKVPSQFGCFSKISSNFWIFNVPLSLKQQLARDCTYLALQTYRIAPT